MEYLAIGPLTGCLCICTGTLNSRDRASLAWSLGVALDVRHLGRRKECDLIIKHAPLLVLLRRSAWALGDDICGLHGSYEVLDLIL